MSSRPIKPRNQSLSQQTQSNSVANLLTELGQRSTRGASVEDGNQTDSVLERRAHWRIIILLYLTI